MSCKPEKLTTNIPFNVTPESYTKLVVAAKLLANQAQCLNRIKEQNGHSLPLNDPSNDQHLDYTRYHWLKKTRSHRFIINTVIITIYKLFFHIGDMK